MEVGVQAGPVERPPVPGVAREPAALLIGRDPGLVAAIRALGFERIGLDAVPDLEAARVRLEEIDYSFVFLLCRQEKEDGGRVLEELKRIRPAVAVYRIDRLSGGGPVRGRVGSGPVGVGETARERMRAPSGRDDRGEGVMRTRLGGLVGVSESMQHVYGKIARAAAVDCVVLLQGESGTGKELAARAIHGQSARRGHPFIPVNCSAIPEQLMESELFGYVRGAFSGAVANTQGILRAASGGTVFFDEIGELSLGLQAKLLRFVEDKVVKPLGSESRYEIDVRIVVATNADLRVEIDRGGFRRDLFYRINVLPIFMPPLRSKKEDLPLLVDHFLGCYGRGADRIVRGVSPEVMGAFFRYAWPGNVRELENLLLQAIVMSSGPLLTPGDFPPCLMAEKGKGNPRRGRIDGDLPTLREVERELIERALRLTEGNVAGAARLLGIDRKTVYRKVKRHAIQP